MRVLSLFSGIGGFDLGFERAGMTITAVCELDKHARGVLERRFPNAIIHTDVKEISYAKGSVDLICGGFPCQDLSTAGKRQGLDGEQSGLWFEFARIIDEVEPAWVVIENVPGLLTSAGGADFAVIIQWLAQRGYGVGWRVFDAQGFGLAQRRKRVFIVASFGSPRGCTVLLEPQSLSGSFGESGKKGTGDSGTSTWSTDTKSTGRSVDQPLWEMTHVDNPARFCQNQELAPTLVSRMGTGGNSVPLIGLRRLTPTECERLQGFPDGWTEGQSDTQRYKQLGNAVAVPVAEWIGKKIQEVVSER